MNIPADPDQTVRLKMHDIHKRFGATVALGGVDLAVSSGEVHALVGENGAGKSTLKKVLSGAHSPDQGRMWLDGLPYAPRSPLQARRNGVAMIYQELSLAPHLSVMENILLGIEPTLGPLIRWKEVRRRAIQAIQEVGDAKIPPEIEVRRLPIAQQQMVEIARAVALESRVLVLDEPTSSLTRHDIEKLFSLIGRLRAKGLAVIYISHFLEEVQEISDRFTVLRDGRTVGGGITADAGTNDIVALMVGRQVDELYPSHRRVAGDPILEIRNLTGIEKPVRASLTLRRGEVLGIAGLVGAGRTELMRAIFGLDAVVSGKLKIGQYEGPATPARRWRQGTGMVSEDRKNEGLAVGLSIADNVTLPALGGLGPLGLVTPTRQAAACERWLKEIPIRCQSAHQSVGVLSGGNQQKVALARLLHADVDVLLLDEPTRGIDVGSKAQIYQLINQLAAGDTQTGTKPKSVLIISSYLPELLGTCDRIAVMHRGTLTDSRPADRWTEHDLMLAATGGE
jgi:ribose transport system ATP-binding protein